jgi:hypothetical protein
LALSWSSWFVLTFASRRAEEDIMTTRVVNTPLDSVHTETGPGFALKCWCEIGRDHTFAEFVEANRD